MDKSKISIIIPIFNGATYLRDCLQSVVKQSLRDIEIICIDDGSTDDTASILNEFACEHPNIRVFQQENMGAGIARNFGIENAQGEFVCFLDADDWYPNDAVLEMLYLAAKSHNAKICGGSFSMCSARKTITCFFDDLAGYTFDEDGFVEFDRYQFDYGFHRFIFDREFLLENKLFFPNLLRYQDPPFLTKAMLVAGSFYAITDVVYRYRLQESNSAWPKRKVLDMLCGVYSCIELATDNGLWQLARRNIDRLNYDYYAVIAPYVGDSDVQEKLQQIQDRVDALSVATHLEGHECKLFCLHPEIDSHLKPKKSVGRAIADFLLWLPRKIGAFFRCWHRHGFRYLVRRIFCGTQSAREWEKQYKKRIGARRKR